MNIDRIKCIAFAGLIALGVIGCTPEPPEINIGELTTEEQYFLEIVFGNEFGTGYDFVRKWESDMRIYVSDTSYSHMIEELDAIIDELNGLVMGISISRVSSQSAANYFIVLGSASEYVALEPSASNFVDANWGLFWLSWDNGAIYDGSMYVDMIRTTEVSCQLHLLREELTQSLGPMNDSHMYSDSMFQQSWTCITEFSELDRFVVETLYDPRITAGMSKQAVTQLLLEPS